jgi:hypothetical protein
MIVPVFFLFIIQLCGSAYFIAPAGSGGSDSNPGTLAFPWLSPNHSLNGGDVITAAASTAYSYTNFTSNKWGSVSCSGVHCFAELTCASFDACKIIGTSGMNIDASHWWIDSWEITINGGSGAACFLAQPRTSSATIYDILFSNDIANGCGGSGIGVTVTGSAGVDYIAIIASIAWNAAQGSANCYSGFNLYQPVASDSVPGTHIYLAQLFAWDNFDPAMCAGAAPTDGEGIIYDQFASTYFAQTLTENVISFLNGGRGLSGFEPGTNIVRHGTFFENNEDSNDTVAASGEILMNVASHTSITQNILVTHGATTRGGGVSYAVYVVDANASDTVAGNVLYSIAGNNVGVVNSPGFVVGSNTTGQILDFPNPIDPGEPSCGGKASVIDCMSAVIAGFSTVTFAGYGYQTPGPNVPDLLFPQWLCGAGIPAGLITTGCIVAGTQGTGINGGASISGGATITR